MIVFICMKIIYLIKNSKFNYLVMKSFLEPTKSWMQTNLVYEKVAGRHWWYLIGIIFRILNNNMTLLRPILEKCVSGFQIKPPLVKKNFKLIRSLIWIEETSAVQCNGGSVHEALWQVHQTQGFFFLSSAIHLSFITTHTLLLTKVNHIDK